MSTIYGTPVTFGGNDGAKIGVTLNEDSTQNVLLSDNGKANLDTSMPIASVSYNGVAVPLVGSTEDNKFSGFTYTGEYEMSDAFNYGLAGDYEVLVLKSSGILTFDKAVSADVFMVGGGGGGSRGMGNSRNSSGGGGGGYTATYTNQAIGSAPIDVVIGAGGAGAINNEQGGAGGATSFGPLSVSGARQPVREDFTTIVTDILACGGRGGSGGGSGTPYETACSENVGGSDGSDGGCYTSAYPGGKGQGTTTRAFGESGAKLFAGGGGGGNHSATSTPGGAGGGGLGGGNAAAEGPTAGEPNTGGGGGGASDFFNRGADGGSGVVLIRLAQTA